MGISWEAYSRMEEEGEHRAYIAKITEAIRARGTGHCSDFLCAFDGKDADLEPGGCCGIVEIIGWYDSNDGSETFRVKVGGHKTFWCPDDEGQSEEAEAIVSGTSYVEGMTGDWSGEDWGFGFKAEIEVRWQWRDGRSEEANFAHAAAVIVRQARKACRPFRQEMTATHEAMDRIGETTPTE
jgi:hypothetical protein